MKKGFLRVISIFMLLVFTAGILPSCTEKGAPSLSASVESVPAMSHEIRISFSTECASFKRSLDPSNIELSGAFEGMKVTVESVSGKNAQLLLTGSIKRNESCNAYDDGFIEFKYGSFSDAEISLSSSIRIEAPSLEIDQGSSKLDGGKLYVSIEAAGYVISPSFSASDVTFEDTAVESASANDGVIRLAIKTDASSLDSALSQIDRKKITLKAASLGSDEDACINTDFSTASFYYSSTAVQKLENGSAVIVLELVAANGSFASGFGARNIIPSGDIEGASVESVSVQNGVAAVSLLISDSMAEKLDGGLITLVELKEGSLINKWGTSVKEPSYFGQTVSFPPSVSNSTTDYKAVRDFCNYVGNSQIVKALGPFGSLVNLVTGSIAISYDASKLCGFLDSEGPSELDVICGKFDEISAQLSAQDAKLDEILKKLDRIELNKLRQEVEEFTDSVSSLGKSVNWVSDFIESAPKNLTISKEAPKQSLSSISQKLLNARTESTTDDQLVDLLSDKEKELVDSWSEYYEAMFTAIEEAADKKKYGNPYKGYDFATSSLEEQFVKLCDKITSSSGINAIDKYDQLCRSTYIFDATALPARELYRANTRAVLDSAMSMLFQIYGGLDINTVNKNVTLKGLYQNYYLPAIKNLESKTVKLDYSDSQVKGRLNFYPSTTPSNFVTFSLLGYDYDINAAEDPAKRQEIEKNAKKYYDDIRERLFWSNLSDSVRNEVKHRMDGLGYVYKQSYDELMVYEANTIAQVLGYPIENTETWIKYRYYYLASFDSVEFGWECDVILVATLKNCVMYDILTGELKRVDKFNYYNGVSGTDGLYALHFMSKSKK